MKTVDTLSELRETIQAERNAGQTIAFVPTMGNLHAGHLSLVDRAHQLADFVVTSIFVNPMQFGANEDLDAYPRTLQEDASQLQAHGNHLLFTPTPEVIYPRGMAQQTQVSVPFLTELHCGASRPGHFNGVTTVVSILFNMVMPDIAVFGEKDYQQLAVIRKMTEDLFFPIKIIGMETARDTDGLALSSRNGYLTPDQRAIAPTLYQTLQNSATQLQQGEIPEQVILAAEQALTRKGFTPDYYNIVDSTSLQPVTPSAPINISDKTVTILAAAFLGQTRLIDNINVTLSS
ncbi:MAG: pantoate--beta-alanine ligase [Pseudomonadales bacterium]|nr:pantoate--beta-alanine ligase [Pseudomonadales bacterium]